MKHTVSLKKNHEFRRLYGKGKSQETVESKQRPLKLLENYALLSAIEFQSSVRNKELDSK